MFDSSVNLTDRRFREDYDGGVLDLCEKASRNGVAAMVCVAQDLRKANDALGLARTAREKMPVYTTAGIHPHQARFFNPDRDVSRLRILLEREGVVAVGECGLDFERDFSRPEDQRACFEAQLKLAIDKKKPMYLRERGAFSEMVELLDKYRDEIAESRIKLVLHGFLGTREQATEYVERGLYLELTGALCDRRRNRDLLEAVSVIPLDRLLVGTDAPFAPPVRLSGPNEPANLGYVVDQLATKLGRSFDEVAAVTMANARTVLGVEVPTEPTGRWVRPPPVSDRRVFSDRRGGDRRGGDRRGGDRRFSDRRGDRRSQPKPKPFKYQDEDFPSLPARDAPPKKSSGSLLNWGGLF